MRSFGLLVLLVACAPDASPCVVDSDCEMGAFCVDAECVREADAGRDGSMPEDASVDAPSVMDAPDAGADACSEDCGVTPPLPCTGPAETFNIVLDCASGTTTRNTGMGTSQRNGYCARREEEQIYFGPENVFTFDDSRLAVVTITAEALTDNVNMDLFVLDGGDGTICSSEADCVAESVAFNEPIETVTFNHVPGSIEYIAYDVRDVFDVGQDTDYSLSIECAFSTCGDSALEGAEECDDGNTLAGDGCSPLCQEEPGFACTHEGEESSCLPSCPDGVVNGDDVCDDGGAENGDGCSEDCQVEPSFVCQTNNAGLSRCVRSCGNGFVDGDDVCDDGGRRNGDGCSSDCTIEAGYACPRNGGLCALSCGDGRINGQDTCDDGNTVSGDGCSESCIIEANYSCPWTPSVCVTPIFRTSGELDAADLKWDPPLSCRDFNRGREASYDTFVYTNSTDTEQVVDIVATFDGFNGDVYVFEEPVDGQDPSAHCVIVGRSFQSLGTSVINGFRIAPGESWTVVVSGTFGLSRGSYELIIAESLVCGDGLLNFINECDDSNRREGDGCSAACTVEDGFACGGVPSVCGIRSCGNGTQEAWEVCDDGNREGGDGCEADCLSAVFTGRLGGSDPVWARPESSCAARTDGQANFYYDVTPPLPWAGLAGPVTATVTWRGFRGYVFAYSEPLDPENPEMNCVTGIAPNSNARGSQLVFDIARGSITRFVLSSARAGESSEWTLTLTHPRAGDGVR